MSIKKNVPVITIDGPTASGKGTIARKLSDVLGWSILDSGAIYRSLAFYIILRKVSLVDINSIVDIAREIEFSFINKKIFIDGVDVSHDIRSEEVGHTASIISANKDVRHALLDIQRSFLEPPGLIADGRDMGAVVFPFASLKIFLTANIDIRVERRYKQLIDDKVSVNMGNLRCAILERDLRDSERLVSPLIPDSDAYILDNSYITDNETVNVILNLWKNRLC
ncbi:cytidylate kinase [Candidatus Kinetoplastibacterium desouzaii TCC079E]|uniref:Cytidylate kinase n=1 Tax=Candidatus Kinetoplastidibacterium desouzai TCC079E TaxID=1208919 RepID=M1LS54_9PROT|nr:(d)CMP kinase [Candidatus Kinetoplastibacterium desouzaii]AGF46976.1 cytidylate kinase [Candidatus Kinetoplastibacterium desouzaii TCC079E]